MSKKFYKTNKKNLIKSPCRLSFFSWLRFRNRIFFLAFLVVPLLHGSTKTPKSASEKISKALD
jgi:hypothetical protein